MPVTHMSLEEKRRIEEELKDELKRRALEQGVVTSEDDLVIRDLLPKTDLGATNEVWTQTLSSGNAYNNTYTPSASDKKVIGIYGVKNKATSPLTTAIKFSVGSGGAIVKDIWEIESVMLEENTEGIATMPIIYDKNETITIAQYASGTGTDGIILLGLVAEPKGENVQQ